MTAQYLTPDQDRRLRRWEQWNRGYFLFAFVALITLLVFSSQLGLSSDDNWGPLGLLIAALIAPIVALQFRLTCPACGERIGWQAKMLAPAQCRHCKCFLQASTRKQG